VFLPLPVARVNVHRNGLGIAENTGADDGGKYDLG
jgi:hypothetical protein